MSVVHLISGLPCSGKTTYSARLRDEVDGVLITLDQWLITVHGRYRIIDIGQDEHIRRVVACRQLIWQMTEEFLRIGTNVVLDDGFFWRKDRLRYFEMTKEIGSAAVAMHIHALSAPLEVLRERVESRNASLPTFNFWIDPELLESFIEQYEVPQDDEAHRVVRVPPAK